MCKFSIHLCRQKKKEKSFISLLVKRKNEINQTSISIVHYYRLLRPLWNTDGPCKLIGSNWCDLFTNRTIFCFKSHLFPSHKEATLKTKQPIRFQGLFKVTNQIAGKWKTKSIMWKILQLLIPKLSLFLPQKWMNLISNRLSTTSIKYLNWPSPVFGRFQNGCNKVVIEPRVVQFWSEIILVISNRTRAARSFDFEITRMISAQIALHSVQLPL